MKQFFNEFKQFIARGNVMDMAVGVIIGGALMLGNFISAVLNFLVMALVVFCLVKALNSLHRKKEEEAPAAPAPSEEEKLLAEIRDLLKEQRNG